MNASSEHLSGALNRLVLGSHSEPLTLLYIHSANQQKVARQGMMASNYDPEAR